MDVPGTNPCIDCTQMYHSQGHISMGYNLATIIIECSEVQLYDFEVKVKMAEHDVLSHDGTPT
jgi:hypothetical protein